MSNFQTVLVSRMLTLDLKHISLELNKNRYLKRLFFLLIATDIIFIALHYLYRFTDLISDKNFSLGQDRGYAEFFQYGKEFWIALLLVALALRLRSKIHLYLGFLFTYFLLDDSLKLHETFGRVLADTIDFPTVFHLRSQDLGELVVYASVGLFFFIALATAYYISDSEARKSVIYLFYLLIALLVFGFVLDMVHEMIEPQFWRSLLVIVEDGGENIVMTIILWFVFLLNDHIKHKKAYRELIR